MIGRAMSVDEVLSVVVRDDVFYRHSKGGVTASGGEPLMYARFLKELFGRCRARGINTALETCGEAPWERFEQILEVTDLFLFDVKHLDPIKHLEHTGTTNSRILENLRALARAGKDIIVRVPVIPGFNDTSAELCAIADFVGSLGGTREMHLLPFHRLGISKYTKLEREYPVGEFLPPEISRIRELADTMRGKGVLIKVEI
jgi:pyruvate formate lyase activating enzyme